MAIFQWTPQTFACTCTVFPDQGAEWQNSQQVFQSTKSSTSTSFCDSASLYHHCNLLMTILVRGVKDTCWCSMCFKLMPTLQLAALSYFTCMLAFSYQIFIRWNMVWLNILPIKCKMLQGVKQAFIKGKWPLRLVCREQVAIRRQRLVESQKVIKVTHWSIHGLNRWFLPLRSWLEKSELCKCTETVNHVKRFDQVKLDSFECIVGSWWNCQKTRHSKPLASSV